MTYTDIFYKKQARVPTWITILTIVFVVLVLTRLVTPSAIPSKASKRILPQVKILNISTSYATFFWETDNKESGWVIFGDNKNNITKIAIDDRDLQEKKSSYFYHYVTLKDLEPNKNYYLQIVSNNRLVDTGRGEPFQFKTPGATSVSNPSIAYGKVTQTDGNPMWNAPVVLTSESGLALGTLTKSTGEWLIPLGRSVGDNEKIAIDIYGEGKRKTHILTDGKHVNPIPNTVVEGKDYSFIEQENVLAATTLKNSNKFLNNEAIYKTVDIFYPKDGMIVDSAKPLIKGIALPNTEINISLSNSPKSSFKLVSDGSGIWNLNIADPLPQGKHVIVLTAKDEKGKSVRLERNFTTAKSGEQVMGTATASASPTVTRVPTILMPTSVSSPSATATSMPSTVAPIKPPPESGSSILPYALGSISFIIVGIGLMLAF